MPERSKRSTRGHRKPLVIEQQGSFFYGGKTITAPGSFNAPDLFGNSGDNFTVDKGYAWFQIPPDRRRLPLVMWHGGGQTGVTFEKSEDREGYASMFVRRGWAVYTIDEPRRGKAGITTFSGPFGSLLGQKVDPSTTLKYGIKAAFEVFRLGDWLPGGPSYFPGTQFPRSNPALERLNSQTVQMYTEDFDQAAGGARQVPLFDKIGPAILVTHSFSGPQGWYAAMGSPKVQGIVGYEPGSSPASFIFPIGETRPSGTTAVPMSEFMDLTRVPIQIVYGDFFRKTEATHGNSSGALPRTWRASLQQPSTDMAATRQ